MINERSSTWCKCRYEYFFAIVIDYLLEQAGRASAVFHCTSVSSGEDAIKNYLERPQPKQDLVVTKVLAKGYEAEFVMNLSKDPEYFSRSCGYNMTVECDGLSRSFNGPILDHLKYENMGRRHDCDLMFDREYRNAQGMYVAI